MSVDGLPPPHEFEITSAPDCHAASMPFAAQSFFVHTFPRPMRNAALMRRLGDISQKMLTQTLKELERNGLVIREDKKTVPPHVEYSLSPVGRSLSETLLVLDRWAETHFGALDAAREHYDAKRGG